METKKNGSKKSAVMVILAVMLVACLAVAGVSAYFTDGDTTTNTFTIGKISLDLQEPNWVGDKTGDALIVTPNREIAKDPQIKNDGVNAEYVFATVAIPYANVKTANLDGTLVSENAANTQLYSMLKVVGDATTDIVGTTGAVTPNEGWYFMGYLNDTEEISADVVFRTDGTVKYLFAYGAADGMTALEANVTTIPIFNTVRFANVIEDQAIEGEYNIVVNAYGIQTDNINDTIGGGNADGKVIPTDVWAVVHNANPSLEMGTEDAVTDIKTAG